MAFIIIQDSTINPEYAEVFGNALANSAGFLATKAKVRKDSVTDIQLAGNQLYVDVFYANGKSITLDPKYIDEINGHVNTEHAWTAAELYDIISTYLNI